MLRSCLACVLLALGAAATPAQMVPSLPGCGPAPLLFVRFLGPEGMRTTLYQGRGHVFPAPVVVGLRPGYLYRVKIDHLPGRPGLSLYPTLEVRGSLFLPPHLGPAKYPAPIVLTEADIESVLTGAMVTKVIYLEHPDYAPPTSYPPDQPAELDLPANSKLLDEARARGRPMLIVRLGGRLLVSEQELAESSVYGTILYPGEHIMPPARLPPCLLLDPRPFHDPRLGPRPPEEECLHDGGDQGIPAGFDIHGQLAGLEPEDTVAEYTDSNGRRQVTHSNRVCLCVPRFAVLRSVLPLGVAEAALQAGNARAVHGQELLRMQQPSSQALQYAELKGMEGRLRVSNNVQSTGTVVVVQLTILAAEQLNLGPLTILERPHLQVLTQVEWTELKQQVEWARELSNVLGLREQEQMTGTAVVGRVEGLAVIKATAETRDLTVCCNEAPCPPDKPLVLVKCASCKAAHVGDIVTFTLRYSNHGGRPIDDVAVVDSLATRLEYVPGTSQSDRNAVFTVQQNEAGSVQLRWEITGRLLPGQSGVVRFQARVR